jgi:hypothetical protein
VDFYVPEEHRLVQVTQNLKNPIVREREIRALTDAIPSVKVKSALILTDSNEAGFKIKGVPVEVRSVSDWLLHP